MKDFITLDDITELHELFGFYDIIGIKNKLDKYGYYGKHVNVDEFSFETLARFVKYNRSIRSVDGEFQVVKYSQGILEIPLIIDHLKIIELQHKRLEQERKNKRKSRCC